MQWNFFFFFLFQCSTADLPNGKPTIGMLLDAGADPNKTTYLKGLTPFELAPTGKENEIIFFLLFFVICS
jgi:hypothetical protein